MFRRIQHVCGVLSIIVLLAACSTTTPAPATSPTEPPTVTPVPPTATSVPTRTPVPPTHTPFPTATPHPTNTPAPTATPQPTDTPQPSPTKAITPKPTNTRSASVPGGVVSSQPSTLQISIEQASSALQGVIALLYQMADGGGAELCAPLIEKYQSIHNAPTYDMSGQSNEAQQAYGAYRDGIHRLDERADLILSCGQGGGSIDSLNLALINSAAGRAVTAFAQAQETLTRALNAPTLSPLESAIAQALQAVGSIGDAINQMVPNKWARGGPVAANDPRCVQAINAHNALRIFTMDPAGQPAAVQTAYQLYQEAMNEYQREVSFLPENCAAGTVVVTRVSISYLAQKVEPILNKLHAAQNALK